MLPTIRSHEAMTMDVSQGLPPLYGPPSASSPDAIASRDMSPDRPFHFEADPEPLHRSASGRVNRTGAVAVSWMDASASSDQHSPAERMSLPILSRPTSRQGSQTASANSTSTLHLQCKHPPSAQQARAAILDDSPRSSVDGGFGPSTDRSSSPHHAIHMYTPHPRRAASPASSDQLRIMRLVKAGAHPTNTNAKLARLAAMMDEYKVGEYVHLSPSPTCRPSSRSGFVQGNDSTTSRPSSLAASTTTLEMVSTTTAPSSLLGCSTVHVVEQLRGAKDQTNQSKKTTSDIHAQGKVSTEGSEETKVPASRCSLIPRLTKEEDYWRGYIELEEGQRRYYLWTYQRRGEMPVSSPAFSVGTHTSTSPHVIAATIARSASSRPSSAALGSQSAVVPLQGLPQRPASGSSRVTVTTSHRTMMGEFTVRKTAPCVVALPSANDDPSPPHSTVSCTPTDNEPSYVSPRAAVMKELLWRMQYVIDDVADEEQMGRIGIEQREESSLAHVVVVPWMVKVLPHDEKHRRQQLVLAEREVFFRLTSDTSRYFYSVQQLYEEAESKKNILLDAFATTIHRMTIQRAEVEENERMRRSVLVKVEGFVHRTLLRRWHQHYQVMLVRHRTYSLAMRMFYRMSENAAAEAAERQEVEVVEAHVHRLLSRAPPLDVRCRALLVEHATSVEGWYAESMDTTLQLLQRQARIRSELEACRVAQVAQREATACDEGRDAAHMLHLHASHTWLLEQRAAQWAAAASAATALYHEHATTVLNTIAYCVCIARPEASGRQQVAHDAHSAWLLSMSVHAQVAETAATLRTTMRYLALEYQASEQLLGALTSVQLEEHETREKILDLEDEAYEEDFIISHQRMRRLDTVRSFIIASPAQERRSRLATEAEYREGLYLLMELNDELVSIGRQADSVAVLKANIFIAHQQLVERDTQVVQPQRRQRATLEASAQGWLDGFLALVAQVAAFDSAAASLLNDALHGTTELYHGFSSVVGVLHALIDQEASARRDIALEEASQWPRTSHTVRVAMLLATEALQRAAVHSAWHAQGARGFTAYHSAVVSMDQLVAEQHRVVQHTTAEAHVAVQEAAARWNVVRNNDATMGLVAAATSLLRSHVYSFLDGVAVRTVLVAQSQSVALPHAVAAHGIQVAWATVFTVLQRHAAHLWSNVLALNREVDARSALFDATTSVMQLAVMPLCEADARREINNIETECRMSVLHVEHAVRHSMYVDGEALWAEYMDAVAATARMAFSAVSDDIGNGAVQWCESEPLPRNDVKRMEAEHRSVLQRLHHVLRSDAAVVRVHHSALTDALEASQSAFKARSMLCASEAACRQAIERSEDGAGTLARRGAATLVGIALRMEAASREATEMLYEATASRLMSLLQVINDGHPRELQRKAVPLLSNDTMCTALDFGWFDGANKCSDATLEIVTTLVERNTSWCHLIMSNNRFGPADTPGGALTSRSISVHMSGLVPRLTSLELRNCGLVDDDILTSLLPAVVSASKGHHLETLRLDGNDFGVDVYKALCSMLRASHCSLTDVSLSGNAKIAKGMQSVLSFYCQLNRHPIQLKEQVLQLEENAPTLKQWCCRGISLDDERVKLVCVALFQNSHVTHVDLHGHADITDASCTALASMLRGNASIGSLDVSGTSIGDAGLGQLEHVIKSQAYRQPLMYRELFVAPATQLLRRHSSRSLRTLRHEASMPVPMVSPVPPQETMGGQGGFFLSIQRTRVSDKKYLTCVLSMNELERASIEMDEDDGFELMVMGCFHLRSLLEDLEEAYRETADAYDVADVQQHLYFTRSVLFPAEQRTRDRLTTTEQTVVTTLRRYDTAVRSILDVHAQAEADAEALFQRSVNFAVTAWRMRQWEPNDEQRMALEMVCVPEHQARRALVEVYEHVTKTTVERYHKYVHGVERFSEKCIAGKQQVFERCVAAVASAKRPSVFSLSLLGQENSSTENAFVPQELDPKQHQALAHLGNQPWELQGKGLAIGQNDPSVTVLDVSYAGVSNPEEPKCTQDTIAVLFTLAKNNTSLTEINLSGNPGAVTARTAPLLAKLALRLRTLNLADCGLQEDQVLPHLLGALSQPTCQLEALVLDGNALSAQGATHLCRALRSNTTVSSVSLLRMTGPPIPKVSLDFINFYTDVNHLPKAYRTLVRRLESNDVTLVEADFTYAAGLKIPSGSRGHINDASSAAGCDSDDDSVTPYNPADTSGASGGGALRPLDDTAVKLICIALTRNMVLERLLLGGNQLTDRGMKFLAHVLQLSPSIRCVDVSYNRFTDVGAQLLVKVAEKNQRLQDVRMTTNEGAVGVQARRLLLAQLQKNKA